MVDFGEWHGPRSPLHARRLVGRPEAARLAAIRELLARLERREVRSRRARRRAALRELIAAWRRLWGR